MRRNSTTVTSTAPRRIIEAYMTEWLMMKVMGSMPAIPEIITGWGRRG